MLKSSPGNFTANSPAWPMRMLASERIARVMGPFHRLLDLAPLEHDGLQRAQRFAGTTIA
jgi:hypothetical protein